MAGTLVPRRLGALVVAVALAAGFATVVGTRAAHAAGPNVLFIQAEGSSYSADVVAGLDATGAVGTITNFDASVATPTPADLIGIDVVFVSSDDNFADLDALGDLLADYVDGGGRVVQATFALEMHLRTRHRRTLAVGGLRRVRRTRSAASSSATVRSGSPRSTPVPPCSPASRRSTAGPAATATRSSWRPAPRWSPTGTTRASHRSRPGPQLTRAASSGSTSTRRPATPAATSGTPPPTAGSCRPTRSTSPAAPPR